MAGFEISTPGVRAIQRADGSVILESATPLEDHEPRVFDRIRTWADKAPLRLALADRKGASGAWRTLTYGDFVAQTAGLAQALLDLGAGPGRPILLISENRIEAAVATYAAYRLGAAIAPITPAYSAGRGDRSRLRAILETLAPGLVIVDELAVHGEGLAETLPPGVEVVGINEARFQRLLQTRPTAEFFAAEAAVTPETVAKILFTSGSTGTPKGAINTHRMVASNAQALRQSWPFTAATPPTICDWLPWNHTFGGNFVLNLALGTGGVLYIDDGKPLPGLADRSVVNSAEVRPTIHVNAPRGLDMVGQRLAADPTLAEKFFERLGLVFFASSGLPPRIREDWLKLIDRYAQRPVAFCSAWGTTETAPLATVLNFQAEQINNIGTPSAGTTIKLAKVSGRYELRCRGPNVTPGYLNRPDLTEAAFDEEGYFRTGDAGALADPQRPEAGILIEGRLAEDFKLSSGVWVNVSGLRAELLEVIGPIARDVVISGPNRDELVALVFLDIEACARFVGASPAGGAVSEHPAVASRVEAAIQRHNSVNTTSSRRMAAFRILGRHPDPGAGELTEKGTVNQAAVLKREAETCEGLHGSLAPSTR